MLSHTIKHVAFHNILKLVSKDMDVNEHERPSNITLKTQINIKEQLVVRKDMDVNVHKRQSIKLKHKLKERNKHFITALHFTVTVGFSTMSIMSVKWPLSSVACR